VLREEVGQLFVMLAAFNALEPTPARTDAWLMVLEPYRFADAAAALVEFKRTQPGVFPEPGHLAVIIEGWHAQWQAEHPAAAMPPGGHIPLDELMVATPEGLVPLPAWRDQHDPAIAGGPGQLAIGA
jgi:hypothetical protein